MSDTITPTQETNYPSLSEATENDVREASEDIAQDDAPQEAAPEPVEQVEQVAEAPATEETVEAAEDDAQARTARLARELRESKRRARQLEIEAQALRGQRQETRDETIEREINQRAQQMAANQAVNQKCNDIYQVGVKQFGRVEFDEDVRAVNEAFGQQMPLVLDTITDVPDPDRLLHYLGENPDILDNLAMLPPHKLGAALAREAEKLSRPKARPISKAPPPIRPIATGGGAEPEMDVEKMSMEQLAKMWDKRDLEKRMRG